MFIEYSETQASTTRVSIFQGGDDDEEDEMNSLEALTADAADCMADGAAHDHRGDDEQRDLEERHQTGSSGEGRHRNVAWLTGVVSGD